MTDSVLKRIETERISPRSRLYWLSHEYGLWAAWGATVLFGALSLAVVSFASVHIGYAFYEATHDNFLTFAVENLPYLWLLAFLCLSAAAYFNLRHTKHGYRYPVLLVIGSSIGFSVIGGLALHMFGAGYYLDQFLDRNIPQYRSRAEFEIERWQEPALGRLVGRAEGTGETEDIVPFVDADRHEWFLNVNALPERDVVLLRSGDRVRVLAATTAGGGDVAYACLVMPWLFDHPPVIAELRADRELFIEDVKMRREEFLKGVEKIKDIDPAIQKAVETIKDIAAPDDGSAPPKVISARPDRESPCSNLPVFRAMKMKTE